MEFFENPILAAAGRERLITWHNVLIRDRHGEPAFVLSSGNDITEFRYSQEAARASEQQFRMLFDTIDDAIFICNMDGRILQVNRTTGERLGYSEEELLNMNVSDIDSAEFAALISERIAELTQRGHSVFESAHICRNGSVIPVEISARLTQYAGKPALLGVARDISERKRAEQTLKNREMHTRQIIDTAFDAFISMDMAGIITDWNPEAEKIFGWSRAEALGRVLAKTIVPKRFRQAHQQGLERYLASGEGRCWRHVPKYPACAATAMNFPWRYPLSLCTRTAASPSTPSCATSANASRRKRR